MLSALLWNVTFVAVAVLCVCFVYSFVKATKMISKVVFFCVPAYLHLVVGAEGTLLNISEFATVV